MIDYLIKTVVLQPEPKSRWLYRLRDVYSVGRVAFKLKFVLWIARD